MPRPPVNAPRLAPPPPSGAQGHEKAAEVTSPPQNEEKGGQSAPDHKPPVGYHVGTGVSTFDHVRFIHLSPAQTEKLIAYARREFQARPLPTPRG